MKRFESRGPAKVKWDGREVGFKDVRFSINAGVRVRNRFGVRFRVRFTPSL
jgi:hypothetical protein